MTTGCKRKKNARSIPDEEGVKSKAESMAKVKEVTEATRTATSVLQLETRFAFQVSKVFVRVFCLVNATSLNELKELQQLETSSASDHIGDLVLAGPLNSTRTGYDLAGSAYNVFCKSEYKRHCEV